MPATTMNGKTVYDTGAMVVTGDVVIHVKDLELDLEIAFTPGRTGSVGMPTRHKVALSIGANLATGWEGDSTGYMGVRSSGVPAFDFHYNVGSSREGSAILTWTVQSPDLSDQ